MSDHVDMISSAVRLARYFLDRDIIGQQLQHVSVSLDVRGHLHAPITKALECSEIGAE